MGYYINKDSKGVALPANSKDTAIIQDGAKKTSAEFKPNLVAVIDNYVFQAVIYVYSEEEFEYIKNQGNVKGFFEYEHAKELAE